MTSSVLVTSDALEGVVTSSEHLVLLLERLLQLATPIRSTTLEKLERVYGGFARQNADVKHRWCEIIVKNNHKNKLEFVRQFLTEHQSMGIYLYGEMFQSTKKLFKDAAVKLFGELSGEMDPVTVANITDLMTSSS